MEKENNNGKKRLKTVLKSLFWIVLISASGLGIMLMISPGAKSLLVFLIGFMILVIVVVLIALYINYLINIYKQIKN